MSKSIKAQDDPAPQVERYFVDAQGARRTFEILATAEQLPKDVLHVHGHGGLGKSSLVAMCLRFCKQNGILAALSNAEEVKDAPGLLHDFTKELKQQGVSMSAFEKKWQQFREVQAKVTAITRQNHVASGSAVKGVAKIVEEVAKGALPGAAGPLVGTMGNIVTGAIDALVSFLSKEDRELYLDPQERLLECFDHDLSRIRPAQRVVLFLDTYEQLSSMDDWVRKWAESLPRNVLLVLAGRHLLSRDWFGGVLTKRVQSIELREMTDADIAILVRRYYSSVGGHAPDKSRVDEIVRFASGLPLNAILAAQVWNLNQSDFEGIRSLVVADVFHELRRSTPQHLHDALDAIAAVRWFNRELLRSLLERDTGDRAYEELTALHALRARSDGFALHDTIVANAREYWRRNDPEHLLELHRKALALYGQWLARMEENQAAPEDRQKIILEILFQHYQLSPKAWIGFFWSHFEDSFIRRRQFDFCWQLVNDARKYALEPACQSWLEFYEANMAFPTQQEKGKSRELLEKLREKPGLDPDLKVLVLEFLATSGWYDSLVDPGGTNKARQIYQELDELHGIRKNTVGRARARIWLGVLRQRTEGRGEAHFRSALDLLKSGGPGHGELVAWAQRELSIALRMQGRFADSEELIQSSIDGFAANGLDFQKAHSLLNYGFLLIWRGSVLKAEQQLRESERLVQSARHAAAIECAWLLIGLGQVAQQRGSLHAAARLFEQAAQAWQGDLFGTAVCQASLAELQRKQGQWDQAIELLDRSASARIASEDKFGYGWALRVKGYCFLGKGQFDAALASFTEGREVMRDYQSAFGESELALGLCHLYLKRGRITEFETTAIEVERLADQDDRYMEHLARLNVLRGYAGAARPADSKVRTARQVDEYFATGLIYALQHNIFLLDSLASDILSAFSGNNQVLEALGRRWHHARIDETDVVAIERERRGSEDLDGTHRTPLLKQLRSS